jgi:hypothetical protein
MAESKRADQPTRTARDQAPSIANDGIALLARAINHTHDPSVPYRYGEREQMRFLVLMCEVAKLVESGRIVDLRPRRAGSDPAFQRFVRRAVGRVCRR